MMLNRIESTLVQFLYYGWPVFIVVVTAYLFKNGFFSSDRKDNGSRQRNGDSSGTTIKVAATEQSTTTTTTTTTLESSSSRIAKYLFSKSQSLQKVTDVAFKMADVDKTGKIGFDELYSAILLVHLKLAKYVGAAACYPPSRNVVHQLFVAIDDDKNGYVDAEEFKQVVVICTAHITSRIFVYLLALLFVIPYLSRTIVVVLTKFDDWFSWNVKSGLGQKPFFAWVEQVLTWGKVAEKVVGLIILMYAVRIRVVSICYKAMVFKLVILPKDTG